MTDAFARYMTLRDAFYKDLYKHVGFIHGLWIETGGIEDHHIDATRLWPQRAYPMSWRDLHHRFRKVPRRLELAVTIQGEFCGLALGKPSHGKTRLKACHYEIKDGLDPDWDVHLIMTEAMTLWAGLLDEKCEEVRLVVPSVRSWPVTTANAAHFYDAGRKWPKYL